MKNTKTSKFHLKITQRLLLKRNSLESISVKLMAARIHLGGNVTIRSIGQCSLGGSGSLVV